VGWGEGSREEGELSGSWELFSCSSVSLNHNYCHVLKDLVAGTENLFGEVLNLLIRSECLWTCRRSQRNCD